MRQDPRLRESDVDVARFMNCSVTRVRLFMHWTFIVFMYELLVPASKLYTFMVEWFLVRWWFEENEWLWLCTASWKERGKKGSLLFESYSPSIYPKRQTRIAIAVDDGRTGPILNAVDAFPVYEFARYVLCRLVPELQRVFRSCFTNHLKAFDRDKRDKRQILMKREYSVQLIEAIKSI
jgi:hypothetical protein